ncbi:MAG: replication protein P [Endozoicomonas sp.]
MAKTRTNQTLSQSWSTGLDELQIRAVNYFFAKCQRLYAGTFKARFPTPEDEHRAKQEWAQSIAPLTRADIDTGFKRLRQQLVDTGKQAAWPGIPAVIRACHPTPADLGLPEPDQAWQEITEHCRDADQHTWSHRAVFMAGHYTSFRDIRNAPNLAQLERLRQKFYVQYQTMVKRVATGDDLYQAEELQQQSGLSDTERSRHYHEQQHREVMRTQGISTSEGRDLSMERLKNMGFMQAREES